MVIAPMIDPRLTPAHESLTKDDWINLLESHVVAPGWQLPIATAAIHHLLTRYDKVDVLQETLEFYGEYDEDEGVWLHEWSNSE